jgi:hypothetical protein
MTDKPEPKFIHLVVFSADYEGYGFPEAAFLKEADADALASKLNRGYSRRSSRYEVLSVEIKDGL